MSHLSKIFEEAPIKVQNRNGFDLSHIHAGTSKAGQLVPVLTKLFAPNTTISLGVNAEVNLPPIAAPFYGKADFAIEAFIVPCSILYGGFKAFISNQQDTMFPATQYAIVSGNTGNVETISADGASINNLGYSWDYDLGKSGYALPYFDFFQVSTTTGQTSTVTGFSENPGVAYFNVLQSQNENVYGYMGLRSIYPWADAPADLPELRISLLPALAYHKICDVFYRNTKLTKTWFAVNPNVGLYGGATLNNNDVVPYKFNQKNVSLIWHSFYTTNVIGADVAGTIDSSSARFSQTAQLTFPDKVSVFSTRQRTYMRDYFTSAVQTPQQGAAATLTFEVGGTEGMFTLSSLRMANALDKFLSLNNLSGDYAEMIKNRFGVRPIDADFEEPHYLGRVVVPVYQKEVAVNSSYNQGSSNQNTYVEDGLIGAEAGSAKASGEGSICTNFTITSWSYLMCIASLYPRANYNYGINRELTYTRLGQFPMPELQTVGYEDIKNYEIYGDWNRTDTPSNFVSTFGYIPRYSRFKYIDDMVSGELRPSKTVSSSGFTKTTMSQYQLQRIFDAQPQLSTAFVTIPKNALDSVLAVSTQYLDYTDAGLPVIVNKTAQKLTCWWEIYFNLRAVMPFSEFIIPTLGDLPDTHTEKASISGARLS